MLKDFRDFIARGNVMDLAVAFIIGAAFTVIITSLVNDIIMPPIGMLLGNADFRDMFVVLKQGVTAGPYPTLADAQAAGAVTLRYGIFLNALVSFLIIAFVVFLMVRWFKKLTNRKTPEVAPSAPTTKVCQFCKSSISIDATRCAFCTSDLSVRPR